jgi:hypothetical protein
MSAFASTSTFSLQALALRKACLEMEVPPNFLETGAGEPSSKRFAQTSQNTATARGGLHTLVWRESRDVPFVRQFPIYEHLIFPVVELWRKKRNKNVQHAAALMVGLPMSIVGGGFLPRIVVKMLLHMRTIMTI